MNCIKKICQFRSYSSATGVVRFYLVLIFLASFHVLKPVTASDVEAPSQIYNDNDECGTFCQRNLSELKMLIVVARHGDSAPDSTFPSDVHQESTWPNGFKQLTSKGIERSTLLGKWVRNCYGSRPSPSAFLRKTANPRHVYVRSSSLDKSMQSAQAYLAGAYPPQMDAQIWGDTCGSQLGVHWQPVPVHSIPSQYDGQLMGYLRCPRYDQFTQRIGYSKKLQHFLLLKDAEFVRTVMKNSGIKSNDFLFVVSIIQAAFFAEIKDGRQPVEWLRGKENKEKLASYRDLITELFFNHPVIAKLAAGVLLKEITDRFSQRAKSLTALEHIFYSADDVVIAGLLGLMGSLDAFGNKQPPYSSAIIFELRTIKEMYAVAVYYRNSSLSDPFPLRVSDCKIFAQHWKDCSNARAYEVVEPMPDPSSKKLQGIYYKLDELIACLSTRVSHNYHADCEPERETPDSPPYAGVVAAENDNDDESSAHSSSSSSSSASSSSASSDDHSSCSHDDE